jgi:enoyl-CoA hydratase/carnithine racemase
MSAYATVTSEIRDHLLLIGLNRPKKLNAFNLQMLRELSEAYTEYEENEQLWCCVLFAHGKHFTTGLQLDEVGPAIQNGEPLFPDGFVDPLGISGRRCSKPVICAVHGWCITIGMELLLASDIRVASEDAHFTQLEVRRGIMPFGGATMRLSQIGGWGNGMRHLLTGDKFDAAEAYRIGLVQEIAKTGTQLEIALGIAQKVGTAAPLAVQAALASARTALREGESVAAAKLLSQARTLMHTEDAKEGLKSFVDRREAVFKGR